MYHKINVCKSEPHSTYFGSGELEKSILKYILQLEIPAQASLVTFIRTTPLGPPSINVKYFDIRTYNMKNIFIMYMCIEHYKNSTFGLYCFYELKIQI